jgi:hypothetical protein
VQHDFAKQHENDIYIQILYTTSDTKAIQGRALRLSLNEANLS